MSLPSDIVGNIKELSRQRWILLTRSYLALSVKRVAEAGAEWQKLHLAKSFYEQMGRQERPTTINSARTCAADLYMRGGFAMSVKDLTIEGLARRKKRATTSIYCNFDRVCLSVCPFVSTYILNELTMSTHSQLDSPGRNMWRGQRTFRPDNKDDRHTFSN